MTDLSWLTDAVAAVEDETTTDAAAVSGELPTSSAPSITPSPEDPSWIDDLQGVRVYHAGSEASPRTAIVEFAGVVTRQYDSATNRQRYTFGEHETPVLPSWHTLVATDFSALPTQTFSGDGDVTIDGLTWTVRKYSTKYSTSTFGIANGDGLILGVPTSYGYTAITGRTTPRLTIALAALPLFSMLKRFTPIRAVMQLERVRSDSSGARTMCGLLLENWNDTTRTNCVYTIGGRAASGGSPEDLTGWVANWYRGRYSTGTQTSTSGGVGPIGAMTYGFYMPRGASPNSNVTFTGCPPAIDGYADPELMTTMIESSGGSSTDAAMTFNEVDPLRMSLSLASGVESGATLNRYPVVKKVRLQAFY